MINLSAETKRIVKTALENYRGDDIFRFRAAFKGLSVEQMKLEHGQSGRTRLELLNQAEEHYLAVNMALREIENL